MTTVNEHQSERDTIESLHRDNIFNFFRSHTAYDVLPESGKVVLLDASMSAFGAFHVMAANEQTAVPVWDARSDRYLGMITVSDLLEILLFCTTSENNFKDSLRSIDLAYWLTNSERPSGCPESSVEVKPDDDLLCVLRTLLRNDCRGNSLSNSGSIPLRLGSQYCQSRTWVGLQISRDDCEVLTCLEGTLKGTLREAGIGTMEASKVIKIHPNEPVKECVVSLMFSCFDTRLSALKLMSENGISGIPVVDTNGKFMDMFSDADILGLTELDLNVPVEKALQKVILEEMVVHGSEGVNDQAGNGENKPKHCLITDPLSKVISCFSVARTTRLACLDENGALQGVVTLKQNAMGFYHLKTVFDLCTWWKQQKHSNKNIYNDWSAKSAESCPPVRPESPVRER
eukprot:178371-Hanusia_phi.AAC.2